MSLSHLILLVEDNEANQLLARTLLELDGQDVEVAGDATEMLELLARVTPDLVLMDVQLPGEDGLALTRKLRAGPATAKIPIVALTALAMKGDREQLLEAGCAGYISKPIDVKTFASQVRGHLLSGPSA